MVSVCLHYAQSSFNSLHLKLTPGKCPYTDIYVIHFEGHHGGGGYLGGHGGGGYGGGYHGGYPGYHGSGGTSSVQLDSKPFVRWYSLLTEEIDSLNKCQS